MQTERLPVTHSVGEVGDLSYCVYCIRTRQSKLHSSVASLNKKEQGRREQRRGNVEDTLAFIQVFDGYCLLVTIQIF